MKSLYILAVVCCVTAAVVSCESEKEQRVKMASPSYPHIQHGKFPPRPRPFPFPAVPDDGVKSQARRPLTIMSTPKGYKVRVAAEHFASNPHLQAEPPTTVPESVYSKMQASVQHHPHRPPPPPPPPPTPPKMQAYAKHHPRRLPTLPPPTPPKMQAYAKHHPHPTPPPPPPGPPQASTKLKMAMMAAQASELPGANVNTEEIIQKAKMAATRGKASPSNLAEWEAKMQEKISAQNGHSMVATKNAASQKTVKAPGPHTYPQSGKIVTDQAVKMATPNGMPHSYEEWENQMNKKFDEMRHREKEQQAAKMMAPGKALESELETEVKSEAMKGAPYGKSFDGKMVTKQRRPLPKVPHMTREEWEAKMQEHLSVIDRLNPKLPNREEVIQKMRTAAAQFKYPWEDEHQSG